MTQPFSPMVIESAPALLSPHRQTTFFEKAVFRTATRLIGAPVGDAYAAILMQDKDLHSLSSEPSAQNQESVSKEETKQRVDSYLQKVQRICTAFGLVAVVSVILSLVLGFLIACFAIAGTSLSLLWPMLIPLFVVMGLACMTLPITVGLGLFHERTRSVCEAHFEAQGEDPFNTDAISPKVE